MSPGIYTTIVTTQDGRKYDLGKREHRPFHDKHGKVEGGLCPACKVVDARTVLAK